MQKELFAAAPIAALSDSFSQQKTSLSDRYRLSLKLDQTLVLMIGLLVAYVLVFSFGVETGKRYSMSELRAERAKRERMTEELSRKIFEQGNLQIISGAPVANAVIPGAPVLAKSSAESVETLPETAPSKTEISGSEKPAGRFTIQTVTVASKATAARELKRLAGKGHKAFVIPGGKKLQICVDGFESRNEASRIMKQLKGQGVIPADAYVRSIA